MLISIKISHSFSTIFCNINKKYLKVAIVYDILK